MYSKAYESSPSPASTAISSPYTVLALVSECVRAFVRTRACMHVHATPRAHAGALVAARTDVVGRLPASQVVVIHARQIVVD